MNTDRPKTRKGQARIPNLASNPPQIHTNFTKAGQAQKHKLYHKVVMGGQHRGQRHPLAACNLQQLERTEV